MSRQTGLQASFWPLECAERREKARVEQIAAHLEFEEGYRDGKIGERLKSVDGKFLRLSAAANLRF